jgi:hypothetical protein
MSSSLIWQLRVVSRSRRRSQGFMLYAQVLQADGASFRNILLDHRLGRTERRFKDNPQHGPALGPLAGTLFDEHGIEARLHRIGLPSTSPLSVLAVEILPGPLNIITQDAAAPAPIEGEDPLQTGLGARRILRSSPLTAVPTMC